jgi:hypothetical protein
VRILLRADDHLAPRTLIEDDLARKCTHTRLGPGGQLPLALPVNLGFTKPAMEGCAAKTVVAQ